MAITVAQTFPFDTVTGASSFQKTGVTTTAGNLLVLAILDQSDASSAKVTGVTDSASNVWSQIVRANNATGIIGASIWATAVGAAAISSGNFTIALGASGTCLAQFYEVAGAGAGAGTGGSDVSHANTGTSTAVSSGSSGTPTGTADIAIAIGGNFNPISPPTMTSQAFTTGGGVFVNPHPASPAAFQAQGVSGRVIIGAATAQTFSYTLGGSDDWASVVALWQPAPPGPVRLGRFINQAVARASNW